MRHGPIHRQCGSSLLEVLVAVLVLSFGLLALAGLSASSQQYVKMAQFQTVALQFANEYGERMRSNIDGYAAGAYDKTAAYLTDVTAAAGCAAAQCSAEEMAQADKAEWLARLRGSLPGGDAYVRRDATNPLSVDLWILWTEPGLASDAASSLRGQTSSVADCPAAAIGALGAAQSVPRCSYFRISL